MKLTIVTDSEALDWWRLPQATARVVFKISGRHIGFDFPNKDIGSNLMRELAEESQKLGDVTSVLACAGCDGGKTIVTKAILVGQDETVFGAIIKVLRNVQFGAVAVGKDTGWSACKSSIEENDHTKLFNDLQEYKDLHLVRGSADLPKDLTERIKSSCPNKIVVGGLGSIMKYLAPVPEPTTRSGFGN